MNDWHLENFERVQPEFLNPFGESVKSDSVDEAREDEHSCDSKVQHRRVKVQRQVWEGDASQPGDRNRGNSGRTRRPLIAY